MFSASPGAGSKVSLGAMGKNGRMEPEPRRAKTLSIEWGPAGAAGHPFLARAPGGAEKAGIWQSPFEPDQLRELIESPLCFAPEGESALFRGVAVEHAKIDREAIGQALFASVFRQGVLELWLRSRGALAPGEPLRIELAFDLGENSQLRLYSLPWELMHDGRRFLAWNGHPIVRRPLIDHDEAQEPLRVDKLRILAAVLSSAQLDVDRELRLLARVAERRTPFDFEVAEPADLAGLRRQLEEGAFHGLHLIGHGRWDAASGEWGLDSRDGFLPASHLAVQLGPSLPRLRVVVLNSCRSGRAVGSGQVAADAGVATAMVHRGAVAVVAMQAPISDEAACLLPLALYRRLCRDGQLAAAVTEARLALHDAGRHRVQPYEWAVPVQLERSRAPLFELPATAGRGPMPPAGALAALGSGAVGTAALVFHGGLALAHPPALAQAAAGAAALVALVFRRVLALAGAGTPEEGSWLGRLAGWLNAGRGRHAALGLGVPAAALLLWLAYGAQRLHDLPCLSVVPPGTDAQRLFGIGLAEGEDPALRRELSDLALSHHLQPLDLESRGAAGVPFGCFRYRLEAQPGKGGGTGLTLYRGGERLAEITEPAATDPAQLHAALLRRLGALLSSGGPPRTWGLTALSPSYARNAEALRAYAGGELGEAVEILREAVRDDGDESVLRNNLAQMLVDLAERMLAEASLLPDWRRETGEKLRAGAQGLFAEAGGHLDQALRLAPGQPFYAYNRGRLHQLMGHPGPAAEDFRKALAAWPTFAEAANDLALLELEEGRTRRARRRLEEALRWAAPLVASTHGALLKNLGRAEQEAGHLSAAAAALESALGLAPPESGRLRAEALARLAEVHRELLGEATACVTWRRYAAAGFPRKDPEAGRRAAYAAAAARCASWRR